MQLFRQRSKLQYWLIHRYLPMQGLCQASGGQQSARRSRFDSRPVHVTCVMGRVLLWQTFTSSATVLLLHNHLYLIFAITRRTNGHLETSKSNVVPEIGDTWLGQYFCLVCTGFKINSTRGGVYCSELSIVQTCLLLRAFYFWDLSIAQSFLFLRPVQTCLLRTPVYCSNLSMPQSYFSDLSVAQTCKLLRAVFRVCLLLIAVHCSDLSVF